MICPSRRSSCGTILPKGGPMKKHSLPIIVLLLFAAWHTEAIPAQATQQIPAQVYKCTEDGKVFYQDSQCTSGPNKPLKTQDAKGVVAPKGRPREYVAPPPPAVAAIPYTPSKPLSNSQLPSSSTSCSGASGTTYTNVNC